jgi:hypothetical protein
MGGKRYPLWVRRMAVEAWVLAGKPPSDSMAVAVELFQAMLPIEDRPRNAHDFIVTWVAGWKKRGSVRSKSPSPRRRILDDATARKCIDALLKGYKVNKQQHYYISFRDAVHKNAVIKQVLATHTTDRGKHEGGPISPFYLWRRMKDVDPSLSRHTLRFVHKRTRAQEQERVAYCRRLLAMPAAQALPGPCGVDRQQAVVRGACGPVRVCPPQFTAAGGGCTHSSQLAEGQENKLLCCCQRCAGRCGLQACDRHD